MAALGVAALCGSDDGAAQKARRPVRILHRPTGAPGAEIRSPKPLRDNWRKAVHTLADDRDRLATG